MGTIATVTGADGWETCRVGLAAVAAEDGSITGTPALEDDGSELIEIDDVAMNASPVYFNGMTYATGTLLTFTATSISSESGDIRLTMVVTTPKRKRTYSLKIAKRERA